MKLFTNGKQVVIASKVKQSNVFHIKADPLVNLYMGHTSVWLQASPLRSEVAVLRRFSPRNDILILL